MHPWRKLNTEWLSSSRLRKVSDQAFRLWVMLLTAQDDDGYFELEDAKLAQLVAGTTTWNSERCKALLEELVEEGLVVRDGNFIVLYRGSEFNGMLRSDRPSSGFYYRSDGLRTQSITQLAVSDGQVPASGGLEERKKRGELDKNKNEIREDDIPSSFDEITSKTSTLFEQLKNAYERDIGRVGASLSKALNDFANQHPDLSIKWVDLAFEEAVRYKKVSWPYVVAVLEAWIKQGHTGKERKGNYRGKPRKDSADDANRNQPGTGFEPLSGQRARVS